MTRMAAGRDTHLAPQEIAAEALRQFDAGADAPSMRALARELGVAPSAIYHHFASRTEIVRAAVELVWQEATADFAGRVPDPFTADPVEVLVASGVATRRAFSAHHRLAPHMADIPQETDLQSATVTLMASAFERMGLNPQQAGLAFHAYSSYTVGATLFAADRRLAAERAGNGSGGPYRSHEIPALASFARPETRAALDEMINLSSVDPDRDEELFAGGLRRLVEGFRRADG